MKLKFFFLIVIVNIIIIFLTSLKINQNEIFYYAFDEKIYLVNKTNRLIVKYTDGFSRSKEESYLKKLSGDIITVHLK